MAGDSFVQDLTWVTWWCSDKGFSVLWVWGFNVAELWPAHIDGEHWTSEQQILFFLHMVLNLPCDFSSLELKNSSPIEIGLEQAEGITRNGQHSQSISDSRENK